MTLNSPRPQVTCRANGFALPLALLVLTILMVAAGASFLLARLDLQSGRNALGALRASEAAEAGISELIAGWNHPAYDTLPPGATLTMFPRTLRGGAGYTAWLSRLGGSVFLVESEGVDTGSHRGVARRTLGRLLRLTPPDPGRGGALMVLDSVMADSLWVSGGDTIPPAWIGRCNGLDSAIAGLRVHPATPVAASACVLGPCLNGNPGLVRDSTLGSALLNTLGVFTVAELASRANHLVGGGVVTIQPTVTGSPATCDTSLASNWGEPWGAGLFQSCAGYFPVVFASRNLVIGGGRGQGLLLVAGDLTLQGGAEFYGMILVQGGISAGPGGGRVVGEVRARSVTTSSPASSGALQVQFSGCVLRTSLAGASRPLPLSERSWIQVY